MAPRVIYATSDVHSPKYLGIFRESVERASLDPCILVLAGDLVYKGRHAFLRPLLDIVGSRWRDVSVVAVFGNEEYEEVRDRIVAESPEVAWLDDSMTVVECGGERIGLVGSSGALERPTRWQSKNTPWVSRVYEERPARVEELVREAWGKSDKVILVTHYAPTWRTLRGEDPRIWPEMGSRKMEEAIIRARPAAVIHGHAHKGAPRAVVAGIPVYNVALPLNRRLVEVRATRGLQHYFGPENT